MHINSYIDCKIYNMKRLNSIQKELALAGVPKRVLKAAEVQALVNVMHSDEEIQGCIQGLYAEGLGLVVATNTRLLIINKSFLWSRVEDESYAMINSILYKQGLILGKVLLSTRAREYTFTVLKSDPIQSFMSLIDSKMRTQTRPQM
jgi:hypothetical protein